MIHLNLKHVRYQFGPTAGVEGIDLAIERGEFVSLLGPSGCGKSTTLRLLAGFLTPQAGQIELDGEVIAAPHKSIAPERRNMALIFQSYAVWPHMSVYDNVAYGLMIRKVRGTEIRRRVEEVMNIVGIAQLASRYPHTISGGQQQRVALARALVIRPEVLLLDEPLSNLDAALRSEMRDEIRRIHDALGMTSVYVTHDQLEALMLSDRVAVMNKGRLEQVGTPEQIYDSPATPFVAAFIGHWNCLDGVCSENGELLLRGEEDARIGALGGSSPGNVVIGVPIDRVTLHSEDETRLDPEGGTFIGEITRVSYFGRLMEYRVKLIRSGLELRVERNSKRRHLLGERVRVAIDMADCRILSEHHHEPSQSETHRQARGATTTLPVSPATTR